jgi:hypothetical protein
MVRALAYSRRHPHGRSSPSDLCAGALTAHAQGGAAFFSNNSPRRDISSIERSASLSGRDISWESKGMRFSGRIDGAQMAGELILDDRKTALTLERDR